jgi:hypothetical protein
MRAVTTFMLCDLFQKSPLCKPRPNFYHRCGGIQKELEHADKRLSVCGCYFRIIEYSRLSRYNNLKDERYWSVLSVVYMHIC